MSFLSPILFLVCLFLLVKIYQKKRLAKLEDENGTSSKMELNVPRVPFRLPIVGHILQLGERPYESMQRLADKYGPIYSLYLGQQQVLVLNGTDVIRDALINHGDEFAGRPKLYMVHSTLKGKGVISSPYNPDFFEHKKFLMTKISQFSRRRSSLETNCLQTIRETLDDYREHIDHKFEYTNKFVKNSLSQITSQNVLTMTFGTRMHDKEKFSYLMDLINENFKMTGVAAAFNFIPITRLFKTVILKNVIRCNVFLNNLISEKISDYHEDIDETYFSEYVNNADYNPRNHVDTDSNIIECYLRELMNNACFFNLPPDENNNTSSSFTKAAESDMSEEMSASSQFEAQSRRLAQKRRSSLSMTEQQNQHLQQQQRRQSTTSTTNSNNKSSRFKSFSFDHLSSLVQDLFLAGTETTSQSLHWACLYVAYFPQYQVKIHTEIDRILGREKLPTESDRFKMPYTEAFINETMRFHCAGPILIPRSTTRDVVFRGYKIPADTFVMVNAWSAMRDPEHWDEPNRFNPGRFIDAKTGLLKKYRNPAMIPFGVGKRACIGESIARMQLFLIFTSILQKFKLGIASESDFRNEKLLKGIPGIGLIAPNVSLKFRLR